jgi:outer membrane protein assembly factor BamB
MNRPLVMLALLSFIHTSYLSQVAAEDWPQWRGPERTDVSTESNLLQEWPAEGPTRVWLFRNCGLGYSGPAVVGNRLYIMGARDEKEWLLALDVADGSEVWAIELGPALDNDWGNGPRGTPTVDGDRVYALSGQGMLVCVNALDGAEQWKARMEDFGGSVPNWGYTESVLVDDDRVICTPGGGQGTLLALNKLTGEKIWQSADLQDRAHYSSPIVAEHNGVRQYIQVTESTVFGANAASGAILWRTDWPGKVAVIPTPVFRDGHVYVTSGYNAGCNLFRLGDDFSVTPLYDDDTRKVMKNHHGGVVLLGEHVYGYSDQVGWVCQELMTGKMVWREREALGKGTQTAASGMLICLSESDGHVALVEASPEGWKEKSRFTLDPQSEVRSPKGRIWTHPVVANGKLYLRDQDLLFCFDVQQK